MNECGRGESIITHTADVFTAPGTLDIDDIKPSIIQSWFHCAFDSKGYSRWIHHGRKWPSTISVIGSLHATPPIYLSLTRLSFLPAKFWQNRWTSSSPSSPFSSSSPSSSSSYTLWWFKKRSKRVGDGDQLTKLGERSVSLMTTCPNETSNQPKDIGFLLSPSIPMKNIQRCQESHPIQSIPQPRIHGHFLPFPSLSPPPPPFSTRSSRATWYIKESDGGGETGEIG